MAVIFSTFAATLTHLTGAHQILFMVLFAVNVIDLATGVAKALVTRSYTTKKFLSGVGAKVLRWVVVLLAALVHIVFINVGDIINVDLKITKVLVWYVLSALIFHDVRSALGNISAMGVSVPKGLNEAVSDELYTLDLDELSTALNVPVDKLMRGGTLRLKVTTKADKNSDDS